MTGQYTARIITHFSAAHDIPGHTGGCENLHGHNFKVEVEAQAFELNDLGMAIDFADLKKATKKYTEVLDHSYVNEHSPFDKINPTSENIAKYLYQQIKSELEDNSAKLLAVTVWESDSCCVRYSEDV